MKSHTLTPEIKTDILKNIKVCFKTDIRDYNTSTDLLSNLNKIEVSLQFMLKNLAKVNYESLDKIIVDFDREFKKAKTDVESKEFERIQKKNNKAIESAKEKEKIILSFLEKPHLSIVYCAKSDVMFSTKTIGKENDFYYHNHEQDILIYDKTLSASRNQFQIIVNIHTLNYNNYKIKGLFAAKVAETLKPQVNKTVSFLTDFVPIMENGNYIDLKQSNLSDLQKRSICKELSHLDKVLEKKYGKKISSDYKNLPGESIFKDALQNATMLK